MCYKVYKGIFKNKKKKKIVFCMRKKSFLEVPNKPYKSLYVLIKPYKN